MRQLWWASLAALCACGPADGDGGFIVDGKIVPSSVEIQPGDFQWRELAPATVGGAIYATHVISENDVWFFGRDVRHWDGQSFRRMPLEARGVPGPPDLAHFARTFVFLAPDDIWAAGSALWHFDGTAWTEETDRVPNVVEASTDKWNRFDLATDGDLIFLRHVIHENSANQNTTSPRANFTLENGVPVRFGNPAPRGVGWIYDEPSQFVHQGNLHEVNGGAYGPTSTYPGLSGLYGGNYPWKYDGTRVVSWGSGEGHGLAITEAIVPGDFEAKAELPKSAMDWYDQAEHEVSAGQGDPLGRRELKVGDILVEGDTTLMAVRGADARGRFTFFVRFGPGGAHLLPDRLYGFEPHALARVGSRLFLATAGGAILEGTPQ